MTGPAEWEWSGRVDPTIGTFTRDTVQDAEGPEARVN